MCVCVYMCVCIYIYIYIYTYIHKQIQDNTHHIWNVYTILMVR
jgi:hypothetical protein